MDVASLGFAVDSLGLKDAIPHLDRLREAAKKAEDAAARMATVTQDAAKKIGYSLSDAAKRARDAATGAFAQLGPAASRAVDGIRNAFDGLWKYFRYAVMGAMAGVAVALAAIARNVRPIEGEIASLQDYLGAAWDTFARSAEKNLQGVVHWTLETAANIVQTLQYAFTQAQTLWNRLPGVISEAITNAANTVISGVESMVNSVIGSINRLLELANKIPGVNVGQLGQADFGRLNNANAGAAAGLGAELSANSDANANRSLFDEWGTAANARAWASSTTVKESSGRDRQSEYERLQKSITRQVEAMKLEAETYGMSTSAAAQYRAEQELMRAAIESGVPITGDLVEANRRLAESLADVTAKADGMRILEEFRTPAELFNNEMTRLDDLLNRGVLSWDQYGIAAAKAAENAGNSWAQASDQILGALQTVVGASDSQNKTLIKINQAAALARAIVNVHEGITKALTLPFPANLAAAAATAASGFASVNAIKSMSKTAGVASAGSGSSAAPRAISAAPAAPQQQQAQPQTINVTLQGSRFSREEVRELFASFDDALGDGILFNVIGR
jgi:hypothetical protein